jgi:uncharacterized protein involved in exopolysaccharide biosynthesis
MNEKKIINDDSSSIDLSRLINTIFDHKKFIIIISSIFIIISIIFSLQLQNKYTAHVLITPSEDPSLQSQLSKYAGLASLAGVSIPGETNNKSASNLALLNSRIFLEKFIDDRNILLPLMASKSWDRRNNKLIFNTNIYDPIEDKWVRKAKFPRKSKPSIHEAYDTLIEKVISIDEDKKTGFVKISFTHHSALLVQQWSMWIVDDINNYLRDRDIKEADISINYLKSEIDMTESASLNEVFFELIESKTEEIMLASARPEYFFTILDPAIVPEEKSFPKRSLIVILGFLIGLVTSTMYVIFFKTKN